MIIRETLSKSVFASFAAFCSNSDLSDLLFTGPP